MAKVKKSDVPSELPETGPLRILVVDDIPLNVKVLAAMLRKLGMIPISACSGAEALSLLEPEKPDLVLTDMWMPGMNGAQLAAAIHDLPGYAQLKIVAVTADIEVKSNFDQKEFYDILLKPVTLEILRALFVRLEEDADGDADKKG